jgi:DNA-binding SARP family transcriptional activator
MADAGEHAAAQPWRRVTLLGGFDLTVDGRSVSVPVSIQRVIALLALRGRHGRSRLAGSVWPDTTELRAMGNLRTAMWRANLLTPAIVVPANESLTLAADVEVDSRLLVRAAHDLMAGRPLPDGVEPMLLADGDLLPDWSDDWLVVERERLRQLRLHLLETWSAHLVSVRSFGMAMEVALAALQADLLRESAHRSVILVHLAEGNVADAVQAYRQCREVLAREFGMQPSAETSQLVEAFTARQTAVV